MPIRAEHLMSAPIVWRARGLKSARRLVLFALLMVLETELARRFGLIDVPTALTALAVGLAATLLAAAIQFATYGQIWSEGARGFGHALATSLLALFILVPFLFGLAMLLLLPRANGETTDAADPPVIAGEGPVVLRTSHPAGLGFLGAVAGRRYPLSSVELYAAAKSAAVDLGWSIRTEDEPGNEETGGGFAAAAPTELFLLPGEVAVRVQPVDEGDATTVQARIDLTAALPVLSDDLGFDSLRIRLFYRALDARLAQSADE
ncbi:hypothetical protein HDIA_1219 [Hartmannibacter diazotrophicus]|uniref:DUF1499 domain-containing protein n=1 Tax=Hartmannibacter diazotrophicus TaxID=1482074 RepID=A0A2C9D3B8_9HYPH|nr:DUF1499 domain-containing protein [Hartmannibacter diazotrophicus]SON54760.1 hypothetical protein HDIA_1219 [Hartmannibacter diazotrophicus]